MCIAFPPYLELNNRKIDPHIPMMTEATIKTATIVPDKFGSGLLLMMPDSLLIST